MQKSFQYLNLSEFLLNFLESLKLGKNFSFILEVSKDRLIIMTKIPLHVDMKMYQNKKNNFLNSRVYIG